MSPESQSLPAGVRRILIVDDEAAIQFALGDYFAAHGWEVDCAGELPAAKALLDAGGYAAVIVDLRLTRGEGTEGFDLAAYVRERYPRTSVVLLTAHGSPEVAEEARRRGVDAVLHKPMPLREVAQVVSGLVESGAREV